MDDEKWHYMQKEQSFGPFSEKQLLLMVEKGTLSKTTLIWSESRESWKPAQETFDLEVLFPPPLPGQGSFNLGSVKERFLKNEWSISPPHPWRRYFARMLDIMILGTVTISLIGAVLYALAPEAAENFFENSTEPENRVFDVMATVFLAAFLSAAFIGFLGTSIGKWIFGIKVTDLHNKPIGFKRAWSRELKVWFRGLGLGIPVVVFFTCLSGYQNLIRNGQTTWDEEMQLKVSYRNNGLLQICMSVFGVFLFITITAILNSI